jgi:hypothetical protein
MLYAFCVEACCRQEPLKNGGVGLNIERAVGSGNSTVGLGSSILFPEVRGSWATNVVFLSFRHFSSFNVALYLSVCNFHPPRMSSFHPALTARPRRHLLVQPIQAGWCFSFEQSPLSRGWSYGINGGVSFLFRQQRFRHPKCSGSNAGLGRESIQSYSMPMWLRPARQRGNPVH